MTAIEWALAIACAAMGSRSLWVWSRRRFAGADVADHLLYATFLTGRIGFWFALAGLFAIYGSNDDPLDRAAVTVEMSWYLVVLVLLSAMQFVGGQLLARRRVGRDDEAHDRTAT